MCGILGSLTLSSKKEDESKYHKALDKISHRGPNDFGIKTSYVFNKKVILGHTRLSIIDLSYGGHQPMKSHDSQYEIVFNGEIYNYKEIREQLKSDNYKFKSDSDTEVLLYAWHKWGERCLDKLQGMFAFVVYDTLAGTISCVRDPYGVKPFYYYSSNDEFYFASEIPALLELVERKVSPNRKVAYDYLTTGYYDRVQDTFFEGVNQLLPGSLLTVNLKNSRFDTSNVERWWTPSIIERTDLSFNDATERFRELFLDSVKLHMRSDVPIAAALSGGLDSSAIVCAMRYLEPDLPIHTFSYISSLKSNSEESWVNIVNQHIGGTAHKVQVTAEKLQYDFEDMIKSQGEPFGGLSIYAQYCVYKAAKERGITVTLDGQGADETLAGYHGYPEYRIRSLLARSDYVGVANFLRLWRKWPGRTGIKSIYHFISALGSENLSEKIKNVINDKHFSWLNKSAFLQEKEQSLSKHCFKLNEDNRRSLVWKLRHELTSGGLPSLLRHGDRNSMRWSIESRVPFLNKPLVEFLFSLPEDYLLSNSGETKHILRHAMKGIVPNNILFRKDKIGFETPEKEVLKSLKGGVGEWLEGSLIVDFINPDDAKKYVHKMLDSDSHYSPSVWRLLNYCKWAMLHLK